MQLGILLPGGTEVEALTDVRGASFSTNYVGTVELPDKLPKGAQLKVRGTIANPFRTPATSRLVRVNTYHTAWGGHVYCYAQTHQDTDEIAYKWQYCSRNLGTNEWLRTRENWYDLGRAAEWDDELVGADSNWLCFPDEPGAASSVRWVRCKVTFTDANDHEHVKYSSAVRVHPHGEALYRVTPIIFM